MFIEDDDLAVEEAASAIQTRCLGRKQSTACWLPELRPDVAADAGVVCAGTWDEAENELALSERIADAGKAASTAEARPYLESWHEIWLDSLLRGGSSAGLRAGCFLVRAFWTGYPRP